MLRTGIEELLEGMSDAFVALDADWNYVHVNRRAGELFGRHPDELVGRHIWTVFPEGVGQAFYNAYHRALAEQRLVVIEDYYPPWDRWFENRIHPSPDGLLIFFHDITDRKRAESALRAEAGRREEAERAVHAADERMRALMDNSASAQWVKDLDGTYLLANDALGRLFGRTVPELIGRVCYSLLDEPLRTQIRTLDEAVVHDGRSASAEVRVDAPDGARTVLVQVFPLHGPDGGVRYIGGVGTDVTDTLRMEDELRTRERQLTEAQRIGRVGTFEFDVDARTAIVSAETLAMFGLPGDWGPAPLEPFLEAVLEEDRREVLAAWERAVGGGGRYAMTYRIRRPDGEVRVLESTGQVLAGPGGATRMIGMNRDVTEEHRRAGELRARERLLAEAERIGGIGSFERDFVTGVDRWSDELHRIYGLEPGEVEPDLDLFASLVHPEDREAVLTTLDRATGSGGPFRLSPRIVRPDGTVRHLETHGHVDADGDGRPVRLVGVSQDVTARREAEDRLIRLSERLRLLHQIDVAVLGADTEDELASRVLPRLVEMLPADAAVLKDPEGVRLAAVPPDAPPAADPVWRDRIEVPLSSDDGPLGRLVLLGRGEGAFGVEQRGVAVEVAAQLAIALDQSRLRERVRAHARELEERVAERTRELEDANADLEAFSYSVAHDLRAPLRALQGLSQALAEDYAEVLEGDGLDYCLRIVRAADRMDTLIQDLLAYARLSRSEPRVGPVSLRAVMGEVLAQLDGDIAGRGGRVEVAEPLPDVVGHLPTLVQVVGNLVANALTFTRPGEAPHVTVSATRRRGTVRLEVRDRGIGIDPVHHERIFRIFERLHGMEAYPGTGIGLAIVRRGMERMDGRAGVEVPEGGGSLFWVELPEAGPDA